MTSLKGRLLVASPALVDPNFARTVVLITEHGACFESVFSAPGQSRSDPTHFAGKSD